MRTRSIIYPNDLIITTSLFEQAIFHTFGLTFDLLHHAEGRPQLGQWAVELYVDGDITRKDDLFITLECTEPLNMQCMCHF